MLCIEIAIVCVETTMSPDICGLVAAEITKIWGSS